MNRRLTPLAVLWLAVASTACSNEAPNLDPDASVADAAVDAGCTAEEDSELCDRYGATCGELTEQDRCGRTRAADCGSCVSPFTCGGGGTQNVCGCSEADPALCARLGKDCGALTAADKCGRVRTVTSCGACATGLTCGAQSSNVCGTGTCTAESDAEICGRLGKECDSAQASDRCGVLRNVECGGCPAGKVCGAQAPNLCGCQDSDVDFCARSGRECGPLSGTDLCGTPRSVASCGTCAGGGACGLDGKCGTCSPQCAGKECGDNGCGGSCGACGTNEACDPSGLCVACTPQCAGRACGGNGCGGSCGTCGANEVCNASGICVASSNHAPVIDGLTLSAPITDSAGAVVTATVSDADGPGDLSGGLLRDPRSGQTYKAFTGAVGSYTLTLGWQDFSAADLTFGPTGNTVDVEAVFYDQASASATGTLPVKLACSQAGYSGCAGSCFDLQRDPANCGACGTKLPQGWICDGGLPACPPGHTLCGDGCYDLEADPANCGSCGNDCSVWATTQFGASVRSAQCSAGFCQAATETTSATTCDAFCAGHGAVCRNVNACSPTGAASWGGCATYDCPSTVRELSCARPAAATLDTSSGTCSLTQLACTCYAGACRPDCAAPSQCDATRGVCVDCLSFLDCPASAPRCDATGACVPATNYCLPAVVLSQIFPAGGNAGSVLARDYVELHNRTSSAVNLDGWSIQYSASSSANWTATPLAGSIAAGGYYLVALGGGGTGAALPLPDATGGTNLSATGGKVALVGSTAALSGDCPTGPRLVDLVGYGTSLCSRGTPAAASTPTSAMTRLDSGCTDTSNNQGDFTSLTASPRNSLSTTHSCSCP